MMQNNRNYKLKFLAPAILFGLLFCLSPAKADEGTARVRRFALIVSANDGGSDRIRLRYANSDAKAFSAVLTDLGGIARGDRMLVTDLSKEKLDQSFEQMRTKLINAKNAHIKLELLFYYSGHSNEKGLLLGETNYSYANLKKTLESMPAQVRIAVLDSCASGALVRLKGGRRTAPFLVDSSTQIKGYALLTSSSADETAQESESIGASYFTHYLISGMRGAADTNRDGRVTLNESYAYAFDETLARTESSRGGPQHPNYDFQLAGTGDLVLTDLRATNAVLFIAPDVVGRIFIRDKKGRLVAEINKSGARHIKVGLPPGQYEVTVENEEKLHRGTFTVSANTHGEVNNAALIAVSKEKSTSRGDNTENGVEKKYFAASFVPSVSTNQTRNTENRLAFNFIGRAHSLRGFEAGFLANIRDHSVRGIQLAWGLNSTNELHGLQAGAVNFSDGPMSGGQIGYVNVARKTLTGIQLGFVNIAEDSTNGAQIGIINHVKNGYLAFTYFASDTALINIGAKMGGPHTYTIFGFSRRSHEEDRWIAPFLGFGGRMEARRVPFWMELDVVGQWLITSPYDNLSKLDLIAKTRLAFGVRLVDRLSFFFGPTINTLISEKRRDVAIFPNMVIERGTVDNINYQVSPGFFAGIQWEPKWGRINSWRETAEE